MIVKCQTCNGSGQATGGDCPDCKGLGSVQVAHHPFGLSLDAIKHPPLAANERQVGGSHYKKEGEEQHWDRMWRYFREAWFVGNITKYVERYRRKDGIKDLEKARHYLDKLIELERADLDKNDPNRLKVEEMIKKLGE